MRKEERFWDKRVKSIDKDAERFEQINNKVLGQTKTFLNESDIVLEFGCGTGAKTCDLAKYVQKILAIDISSKIIEAAKIKANEIGVRNIEFVQADIFDARCKEESYSVILAFNILHLLEDNKKVFRRISKLLKPGGLFISVTPCLKEKMSLLIKVQFSFFLIINKLGMMPIPLHRFRFLDLHNLFDNTNLQVEETIIMFHGLSSYFVVSKKNLKT
jgi:2-polyprenyl-3-methyl-5-hydroxy-6-metoxy-1,4-benzoquinol methylase